MARPNKQKQFEKQADTWAIKRIKQIWNIGITILFFGGFASIIILLGFQLSDMTGGIMIGALGMAIFLTYVFKAYEKEIYGQK